MSTPTPSPPQFIPLQLTEGQRLEEGPFASRIDRFSERAFVPNKYFETGIPQNFEDSSFMVQGHIYTMIPKRFT
jgi:hypothetical protein